MSAVKGVNKTKIDLGTLGDRLDPGSHDGRVKVIVDTYEAAALASGSTISMGGKLQKGTKVLDVILHTDNLTNSTQLAVGDAEVSDRYITATNHGSAETVTRLNNIAGRDYKVDESESSTLDSQIIITTSVGEATGTIKLVVLYTRD